MATENATPRPWRCDDREVYHVAPEDTSKNAYVTMVAVASTPANAMLIAASGNAYDALRREHEALAAYRQGCKDSSWGDADTPARLWRTLVEAYDAAAEAQG